MRPAASSTPRPRPSTPQLFVTTLSWAAPSSYRARTRISGTPLRPKPPTASEAPSDIPATAPAALALTLFTEDPFSAEDMGSPRTQRVQECAGRGHGKGVRAVDRATVSPGLKGVGSARATK